MLEVLFSSPQFFTSYHWIDATTNSFWLIPLWIRFLYYCVTLKEDNSMYHVSLRQELYILTEMETRQLFRRMFVTLKDSKELFYPT